MGIVTTIDDAGETAPKEKKLPRKQSKCQHDYQETLLRDYQCCLCNHITKEVKHA